MSCTLKFREFILSGELNPTPPNLFTITLFRKNEQKRDFYGEDL